MKCMISGADLKPIVKVAAMVACDEKWAKPALRSLLISVGSNGATIRSTDLDTWFEHDIAFIDVLEPGSVMVEAKPLLRIIRSMKGPVILETVGPELHVKNAGAEFKLESSDVSEFPEFPKPEATIVSVDNGEFARILGQVHSASRHEPSRFQLCGVYCELLADNVILTATDGKRLTNGQVSTYNPDRIVGKAIMGNNVVNALEELLPGAGSTIVVSIPKDTPEKASIFYFQGAYWRLWARALEGTYPDYRCAIPKSSPAYVLTINRKAFLASIKAIPAVAGEVKVTLEPNCNVVKLVHQSGHSELPMTLDGAGFPIRFNGVYLADALKTMEQEQVNLSVESAEKPAWFKEDRYMHLLMPIVKG